MILKIISKYSVYIRRKRVYFPFTKVTVILGLRSLNKIDKQGLSNIDLIMINPPLLLENRQ